MSGMLAIRITPACAGSTCSKECNRAFKGDHPRLRGEYALGKIEVEAAAGSPPLARGVRRMKALHEAQQRITPACAGSTLKKA